MKTDRFAKIQWKAYSVAKLGNSPGENEDAFFPEIEQQSIPAQAAFACAVADGATQTSFSRIWAQLLVAAAVKNFLAEKASVLAEKASVLPEGLAKLTASAQTQWRAHISTLSLPWYAEEKVRQGAFATLLWLNLQPAPSARQTKISGLWQALAIGDSCLFQIRKKMLRAYFPPLAAADFKNNPLLLSSNPARNQGFWNNTRDLCSAGDWAVGDDFLLMTDALAAWFVRGQEKDGLTSPLAQLLAGLSTADRFTHWLQDLRASALIKNDDTTVIWIHIDSQETEMLKHHI
jgi:hypothetical protein